MVMKKFSKSSIAIIAVAAAFLLVSCHKADSDNSPVVAQVGDAKLKLNDVETFLPENSPFKLSRVQIEQFVQSWIESELLYQQALKEGYLKRPEIKKRLKEVERDFLVSVFLEQYVDKQVYVSDDDIRRYYDENANTFIRKENLYHIKMILLNSYKEANNIRKRILAGEDFSELAKLHSLDKSKANGGDIGWVSVKDVSPALAKVIPTLKIGKLSKPVKSEIGYHLIQLLEVRKKGDVQTLDEVRDIILMRLLASKKQQRYHNLISILQEKADIATNWDAVETFLQDSTRNNGTMR